MNIHSVGNKTLDIRELMIDDGLDILGLTETRLNEHDTAKITEMTAEHILSYTSRGKIDVVVEWEYFSQICLKK